MSKKQRKPFKKASKIEVSRRRAVVKQLLLKGFNRHDILDYFTNPPKNAKGELIRPVVDVGIDSVDWYIGYARDEMQAEMLRDSRKLLDDTIAKLEDLFKEARVRGKIRESIEVLKERSSLFDLYPAPKRSIEGDPDTINYIGTEYVDS